MGGIMCLLFGSMNRKRLSKHVRAVQEGVKVPAGQTLNKHCQEQKFIKRSVGVILSA